MFFFHLSTIFVLFFKFFSHTYTYIVQDVLDICEKVSHPQAKSYPAAFVTTVIIIYLKSSQKTIHFKYT